jgi:hypothetical protein
MTLISPSGRRIDRSTAAPDVSHVLGATFESYSVSDPEPGEWSVSLRGIVVDPDGEPVILQTSQVAADRRANRQRRI